MDEKLILKILIAIPTNQWVAIENVPVDGVNGNMLDELHQSGLLHSEWRSQPGNETHYRRSPNGTDWIRNYRSQKRLGWMTLLILLLTLVLVVKAFLQ